MLLCFIAAETSREKEKSSDSLPPHGAEGEQHFAFEVNVEEYESWMKKLSSNGVLIEKETSWKGNLKSFYFRDPDRHLVEIAMPGIWDQRS